MTARELYKWASRFGVEDVELSIQYMDEGGLYDGNTFYDGCEITAEVESVSNEDNGEVEDYILLSI